MQVNWYGSVLLTIDPHRHVAAVCSGWRCRRNINVNPYRLVASALQLQGKRVSPFSAVSVDARDQRIGPFTGTALDGRWSRQVEKSLEVHGRVVLRKTCAVGTVKVRYLNIHTRNVVGIRTKHDLERFKFIARREEFYRG